MPRPPRLHVPGGCYHVILRGNHREALFGCDADRHILNEIVGTVVQRFHTRVHAYCWMTNHLHLLMQIADQPLGKIMQRIAVRYSRYRHRQLRTTGHLFERRYKAKLVDVDAYFLTLIRYIHCNPVKAGIVTDPADYPWSSHRGYLGVDSVSWLVTDFGLSLFSADLPQARLAYQQFMRELTDDDLNLEDASHPKDSRVLGADRFINSIPHIPYRPRSPLTLTQFAEAFCVRHAISHQLLCSPSRARHLTKMRALLATEAIEQRVATLCQVARYLNRDPSSMTKLLARHQIRPSAYDQ